MVFPLHNHAPLHCVFVLHHFVYFLCALLYICCALCNFSQSGSATSVTNLPQCDLLLTSAYCYTHTGWHTNTFCHLHKYLLQFGLIYFTSFANIFYNLDKYTPLCDLLLSSTSRPLSPPEKMLVIWALGGGVKTLAWMAWGTYLERNCTSSACETKFKLN